MIQYKNTVKKKVLFFYKLKSNTFDLYYYSYNESFKPKYD